MTTEDGTGIVHTRARVRRGRLSRRGVRAGRIRPDARRTLYNPVRADGTYDDAASRGRTHGALRQGPALDDELIDELRRARPAAARRGVRALLSALLALPDAAHLLREAVVVHRHLAQVRDRAAGCQRDDRLAPRTRQARALRRLAEEQRRLGALTRALLGHAAADLALPERPHARDRLVRGAAERSGAHCSRTPTARTSTSVDVPVRARAATRRCAACPR